MHKYISLIIITIVSVVAAGCSTSYKATPMPFKTPAAYNNAVSIAGAQVAAKAYADAAEAKEAFGFDVRGAGLLPVQIVFDNQGSHSFEINGQQTFLEDEKGNLWPILSSKIAHERATKHAQTKQILSEGASKSLWGAAAGSVIGAAIGIITDENVGSAAGKGAAAGAAAGAVLGGLGGSMKDDARRSIISDMRQKSMQNKVVQPKSIAHGFLFFPGEALTAKRLRLQFIEKDTNKVHIIMLNL